MLQVPPTDGGLVGFDSVFLPLSLPCSAALFARPVRRLFATEAQAVAFVYLKSLKSPRHCDPSLERIKPSLVFLLKYLVAC